MMKSMFKRAGYFVLALVMAISVSVPGSFAADEPIRFTNRTRLTELVKGDRWTCNGIITSKYPIKYIYAYIDPDCDNYGHCVFPIISFNNTKTYTYNLNDYSTSKPSIDYEMKFNECSVGKWVYTVIVEDSQGHRNDFTDHFEVKPSTLKISSYTTPSTITKGRPWGCNGSITSNRTISSITGKITTTNGSVKYSKTVYPNSKSYNLNDYSRGGIDKYLLFDKLAKGTYYYVIEATDSAGKKTLVNKKFTVN